MRGRPFSPSPDNRLPQPPGTPEDKRQPFAARRGLRSRVSRRTRCGCFGEPSRFSPRHRVCSSDRIQAASGPADTCSRFPPQAATTSSARRVIPRLSACSFFGPTGSLTSLKPFGSVDRKAWRFPIRSQSKPHEWGNLTQQRIVGSSVVASAVDGFSPTNSTGRGSQAKRRRANE